MQIAVVVVLAGASEPILFPAPAGGLARFASIRRSARPPQFSGGADQLGAADALAQMADVDSMAALCRVTRRTVERWRREGCPWPKHREALAKWAARLASWREARDLARRNGRRAPARGAAAPVDWDMQSKRALALQRMHNLAVLRGEYIPRKQVVESWSRRVFTVRTRLLALPRVLAARCVGLERAEIEREADAAVREILAQYQADAVETPATATPDDDQVQP